ncbi:MAG: alanine racemase [Myxococcota bacterium]
MQVRPTAATVELAAIRHNLGVVRRLVGERAVCGLVKADAYGHGLVPVARTLAAAGVDFLAVALVEEGVTLRQSGIETPILVLGGALEGGYDALVAERLTPALFRLEHLDRLARAVGHGSCDFHLKVDTGMARLGLQPDEIGAFVARLATYPQLHLAGVLTHFANADLADRDFNAQQLARFQAAIVSLGQLGHAPRWVHLANSAAVLSYPDAHQVLVRPGLMLYGLDPLVPASGEHLEPAMRWTTRAIHVKDVEAGVRVSYGGRWTASRRSRILTLPVGYGDGYPRVLGNRAQVLIRGLRAPIVGSICMDLCLADVTDVGGVGLEDEVVLLGAQGDDCIGAAELARWGDTIAYEIVCGVGARVPRHYVNEDR